MIPMFQIVQNRAVTTQGAAGEPLPTSDTPYFDLLTEGSPPDQSDDESVQDDTDASGILGAIPLISSAHLPPRPESAAATSGAMLSAIGSCQSGIIGPKVAFSDPRAFSASPSIGPAEGSVHLPEEPHRQPIASAAQSTPFQPAMLTSGAVETAWHMRWADHTKKTPANPKAHAWRR